MRERIETLTRRRFLKAAAWGGAVLVAPRFIAASILGRNGAVAPSERIILGGIGINHRGMYVLGFFLPANDVRFAAICDVRADRRQAVKGVADARNGDGDCATYRDLRELLARDDIDAVLIATGDRWHTMASILAARAGKDVYSEKPCAITMAQCGGLADAMRRYGRIFQAGTQRRNVPNFRFAVDLARSGKLGRLRALHASIYDLGVRHDWLPAEPEPARDVIDWDLWLGPAPWRPYNGQYVAGAWRGHFDFDSGAKLHDWGAHTVDLCQWANGSDGTTPVEYEPDGGTIYARYANGVRLVMRPQGWLGLGTCPVRFEGDEGWVETGDTGRIEADPPSLLSDWTDIREAGISPVHHVRDFLDCMKSRARPATDADIARSSHVACHAAAIAWQLGRKVAFDPEKEAFIGDEEANRMRSRPMREPWRI
ncbi:MAG: Gfo/Idh/MocA family oxidoreductase [Planctomycetes bacterium]|nr:Gfo/Idh/MocA family oxidoreductase [Planctomycetota bacterium]